MNGREIQSLCRLLRMTFPVLAEGNEINFYRFFIIFIG